MENREPPGSDVADGLEASAAIAFQGLFELHFEELYRFAYRYVQSVETAKDLVHEAFLRLWRQRSQVHLDGPAARSYLYTIVRYQALDQLRHRRVEERWRREYVAPLVDDRGAALAADPDQEFAARETAAAIQQAVDALPRRQRQVLLLRWQQQASYDEIAETLSISPKTVAIHIGKAIQRLRELLAQVR
ncbi:MAG: RNA polymerase sigma factor [Gemmatimonadales bacterium]